MFAWLLVVFFAGLIMVLANRSMYEGPDKVEYRYLSRDLDTWIREQPLLAACREGNCVTAGFRPGPGEFDAMFDEVDVVRGGGWPTGAPSQPK